MRHQHETALTSPHAGAQMNEWCRYPDAPASLLAFQKMERAKSVSDMDELRRNRLRVDMPGERYPLAVNVYTDDAGNPACVYASHAPHFDYEAFLGVDGLWHERLWDSRPGRDMNGNRVVSSFAGLWAVVTFPALLAGKITIAGNVPLVSEP